MFSRGKYNLSMQRSGSCRNLIGLRHARLGCAFAGLTVLLCAAVAVWPCTAVAAGNAALEDEQSAVLGDLPALEAARFAIGAAIFAAEWIAAPNVSDGADGLGPLYNASACSQCHQPGGGRWSGRAGEAIVRNVLRFEGSREGREGDPRYGRQLQDRAVAGHSSEGHFEVLWSPFSVTLRDGSRVELRRPEVSVLRLGSGPLSAQTRVSLRRPPPVAGLGLIAAIAEEDIVSGADPDDRDGDGIRGHAGRAVDPATGKMGLARFGWKASAVTLAAQVADAFSLDMGLSSPLSPDPAGDCTAAQPTCRSAPDGRSAAKGGYEVSAEELSLLVAYLEGLAPFRRVAGEANASGQLQFQTLGCGGCHREAFTTRDVPRAPHLSNKPVRLFSDLLLHDLGADLAIPGDADTLHGRSWRTAPLWGLGQRLRDIAAGRIDGLLHDGRARTISEAILWHGGEGLRSRDAYCNLPAASRDDLLAFLAGL